VTLRTIGLILAATILTACPPKYTREPCGAAGAWSCVRDQPHHCVGNPPGWMPIGDEPCSLGGQHCAMENGEAYCAAGLSDGGVQ
jgi:hypothetical protein